jgi:hypothetical protein
MYGKVVGRVRYELSMREMPRNILLQRKAKRDRYSLQGREGTCAYFLHIMNQDS